MTPEFYSPSWSEIIRYMYNKRISLFGIPFLVAVLVAIYSLFIPNRYTSQANLIPSQRPTVGLDLFSESGGLSSLASSVFGGGESEESNRYIVLLSSFTTSEEVVNTFDLVEHYEVSESKTPLYNAIEILNNRTSFESKEEGNFVISVQDQSAELAKKIADFYVEKLNSKNTRIVSEDARKYREFLEERVNKAETDLEAIRQETINFQRTHGVFELPSQAEQYFSLVAGVSAKKIETEVKLDLLSETLSPTNDTYLAALAELNAINNTLENLYSDSDSNNILLNFNNLPELGSRYLDLLLQAEIQAEIQKFLIPLFEQAKMEEAKSLPIVTIIDAPRIAEIKSYPKRSLIVISTGISTFIIMLFYLIIRLNLTKNREFFLHIMS